MQIGSSAINRLFKCLVSNPDIPTGNPGTSSKPDDESITLLKSIDARLFKIAENTSPKIPAMKQTAILICAVALCGCANFSTKQTDESYENGQLVRRVTTSASAQTLIESKSSLANFKATQTDKSQSASVGSLSQESNATNSVSDAAVFLGTLIKTAK